ncbi:Regulator of phospholipase D SRF1 [Talaromyces pinophilus]|nr:Regulator of phospholipase D SRF1 [Talaromyces pinophilus]PCG91155.1 Hypothetical protein PENO1_095310 [Penicillium occitanis (nom. inval.)]PCG91524.1 hypothetical protein PENOC_096990 [Penicillium occitanis (nom. inval.)]
MAPDARESLLVPPIVQNNPVNASPEQDSLIPPRTSATNRTQSSFAITVESQATPTHTWSPPPVRTLPAWVRSYDVLEDETDSSSRLLPTEIDDALVAQHNHSPYQTSKPERKRTRGTDDELDDTTPERESRWKRFAQASAYPRTGLGVGEKRVSFDWLNNNLGDYSQPWGASHDGSDAELGRATWSPRQRNLMKRFQRHLLRSPMVPLILRLTVWIFSLCALALGSSIRVLANHFHRDQGPSANMAIIVDAVALVYLVYITYDEYASKPLGLRSPKAKMRLILLDIFFIVFDAANLSLAFASLDDVQGTCTDAVINDVQDDRNDPLCVRQKALASVLLVALIAWLLTFCISIFRLVERVSK